MQTPRLKARPGTLSAWHFGFGFYWVLLLSLGIGSSAMFPILRANVHLASISRIILYCSLALSFFIAVLRHKKAREYRQRRTLLLSTVFLAMVGVLLVCLAGLSFLAAPWLLLGCFVVGAAVGPLALAWTEFLGAIGAEAAGVSVWGGLLGASGVYCVGALFGASHDWVVFLLLTMPWLSLIWLYKVPTASASLPSASELPAQSSPKPSFALAGIFCYGAAAGLMVNSISSLTTSPGVNALIYCSAGIGLAAILLLIQTVQSIRNLDLGFAYRPVLPLVAVGYLLLPVLKDNLVFIAGICTIAGYTYFNMLTIVIASDMNYRHPNPALALRRGLAGCVDNAGMGVGLFIGYMLLRQQLLSTWGLSVVAFSVGLILLLVSTFLLSERFLSNLWGFARPRAYRATDQTGDQRGRAVAEYYSLTSREREVLVLLAEGLSSRQIEKVLTLSVHTVRTHIKHIYKKMNVHSQWQLRESFVGFNMGTSTFDERPAEASPTHEPADSVS